jgi:hypothetical protein
MTDTNELDGIKQLLGRVVAHLEKLTTEIQELRPLKPVTREYRAEEMKTGVALVAEVRSLRQLADTTLGKTDQLEEGAKQT